ncbi:SAM-dependent methyltransferase [Metabacillus idriensis]|uniref:SAM-dependent methyltransferase n=1 Tax=Metabacillus idriensis TaxID=324768 RepID=A0A6I2MDM8_9BACI|nr:rRNA adenine N-6-methyltransferase family protein [Metabacillus idriensis]MCM3596770.1 SAM-dependent methyltransferase [Metabacillus idriensis]MRX56400.1 SAM-dependent methyltransferase [Metabacillus idriensis]OHR63628.1 SAM-dependent methyltransferase [Bacillus sp. HMSC76G11]
MNSIAFIFQYINKPRSVGALFPSSSKLAERMTEHIDFQTADYIIEYGPGTGIFTDKLIEKRRRETQIILIEQNAAFCSMLTKKYLNEKNLIVINGSAEDTGKYMKQYKIPAADYIISGLPFASLPKDLTLLILDETRRILGGKGTFITFQYSLLKKNLIGQYFSEMSCQREYLNLPPAYVLSCSNGMKESE